MYDADDAARHEQSRNDEGAVLPRHSERGTRQDGNADAQPQRHAGLQRRTHSYDDNQHAAGRALGTGRRWDLLTSNRAARALWTDWTILPDDERNIIWWTFTNPAARTILGDWHSEAAALLDLLRAAAARHPDDPRFEALITRLHAASPEARAWWRLHHIAPIGSAANASATGSSASYASTSRFSTQPMTPDRNWSCSHRPPTTAPDWRR
jgi:MmyB-like transcription regulator ligand binding domain